MTSSTPLITGTDFITVATKDFDAAVGFYGGVLGLPESKRWGQMPGGRVRDRQPDDRRDAVGRLRYRVPSQQPPDRAAGRGLRGGP